MWLFRALCHLLSCINNRMEQVGLLWWCAWETVHSTAWYSPESVWTNDSTVWLADLQPKKYVLSGMQSIPTYTHTHTHTHTRAREGCTMARIVNCCPLTAEDWFWSQASAHEICDQWSGTGTSFFLKVLQFSTVTIIPPIHTHISFICHW